MNTENKEAKVKNRQIWGWSLAIGGGLFTLSGIYYLVITLFGESTNWHVGILDTVPGLLLGIPLLILGIRWIKNRGGNEIINSENIAKNKKHLIWGWIAAIVGGLFTLVGIDSMFYSIFGENPYWYVGIWICTVPGLLLGVPLLIIGIRWIKAVNASQTMDSVNLAVRVKRRRIWGWILALIGGLVVLISIGLLSFISYVMFILSHLKGIVEPYEGYNAVTVIYSFSLFILPLLLIGLSLIILGYIMLRKKETSRQSRGWRLIIMGGVYLIATILSIFYVVMTYSYQGDIGVTLVIWSPILILGILGIVFGIRDLTRKEIKPPTNLISLDNSQGER